MRYQDFSGYAFIRHKPESMIDSPPIEYVFDKGARNGRRQIPSTYAVHDVCWVCDNDPVHDEFHGALEAAHLPGHDYRFVPASSRERHGVLLFVLSFIFHVPIIPSVGNSFQSFTDFSAPTSQFSPGSL
jgi:hypothetical protein